MARDRISDYILSNKYQIFDASLSLGPVLSPIAGFSSAQLPITTVEMKEIKEGNRGSAKKVYLDHDFSDLVLERGTSLLTNDFYKWMKAFLEGNILDKDLIVIQYTNIDGGSTAEIATSAGRILAGSQGSGFVGNVAAEALRTGVLGAGGFEPSDFKSYVPAKGWMIIGAKPRVYDPGGRLEAVSSDISIQRLELAVEDVKEFSTGVSL